MRIRPVRRDEWQAYQRMRLALWPDCSERDIEPWLGRADATTFVAERPGGSLCGFVEVGTRPYADGCETSPVGYVEGWWVDPDVRRAGVGRALLAAAEGWAREQGCAEMASDALLDNVPSHEAHRGCGYQEVERHVVYRKAL